MSLQIERYESRTTVLPRRWVRVLFHGSICLALACAGGALIVWPQWVGMVGARSAMASQLDREDDLTQRVESVRALNQRLRSWQRDSRRVMLSDEIGRYPRLVAEVTKREGALLQSVTVTGQRPGRWRGVSLEHPEAASRPELAAVSAGEIQPRLIRIVMKGSFEQVYRTATSLSQQQHLFVPERWDIVPTGGKVGDGDTSSPMLRAEIWGSVFLIREPNDRQQIDTPESGQVAAVPGGTKG